MLVTEADQGTVRRVCVCTYVCDINTGDAAAAIVAHALNHLVENLARVRLGANRHLQPVHPALGVLAGRALDGDVWAAAVANLLELADDRLLGGDAVRQLLVVDQHELGGVLGGEPLLDDGEARLRVDKDDL